jgi:putative transposase
MWNFLLVSCLVKRKSEAFHGKAAASSVGTGDQGIQDVPEDAAKPYWGNHFGRGCFVRTMGIDEEMIRKYVRQQEERDRREEQQRQAYYLFTEHPPPGKP